MLIYYLEDDIAAQELTVYALRSAGFEARGFGHARAFLEACEKESPDVILLDIMLPDTNGLEVLQVLRSQPDTAHIPVMMLTAKGTEFDKVMGLDSGADDYLVKPFGMMELISRVNALLRRAHMPVESRDDVISVGGLVINKTRHSVTLDGSELTLTLKEFNLLALLVGHNGRVYTREQLMEQVWDTSFVGETRTIDVHVQKLRQKLDEARAGYGANIRTIRGIGYCFKDQP